MKRKSVSALCLLLLVSFWGLACASGPKVESEPEATVTKQAASESPWTLLWVKTHRANLREGPGDEYYVITPMVKGAPLILLAKQGEWYQVNLRSASLIGWIHESVVSEEEVPRE